MIFTSKSHRERKYQHLILCPQITQNSFREHEFIPIVGELPPSSGILKKKHLLMSSTMQLELSLRSMPLIQFSSVQSLTPVSLRPHGLEHTRLLCPSLFSTVCSNSCLLSWWCHPTILYSVVPFSSYLQPFPASRFFLMSQLFTSGGQNIGASTLASLLPIFRDDFL